MRITLIIMMLILGIGLTAIPIMLDVNIDFKDQIKMNWKIVNPVENMIIEVVCLQNEDREQVIIADDFISGDHGLVGTKEYYNMTIDPNFLPDSISVEDIIIFPKLILDGKIYYEMERLSAEEYNLVTPGNVIEFFSCESFYISKFEVTNEQYLSFINCDGYEIEDFWKIAKNIMSNAMVGWNYQGSLQMQKPMGWDLSLNNPWKKTESNKRYGPVTNVRWFEANAFCNWMNVVLPTKKQMQSAFSICENNASDPFKGIGLYSKTNFPLQNVKGGVSEWLRSGVPPMQISCTAGCNEMYFLGNNGGDIDLLFYYEVKCPLYRNPILGFRYIVK